MPKLTLTDPSFAQTAPHKVVVERTVEASPEAIWTVLSDNTTWTSWFTGMSRCDSTSSPATGIGSTRTVKVGPLVAEERFISWEPNKLWGFSVIRTNLPVARKMLEQVELVDRSTPTRAASLVRYTGAFVPHRFAVLTFALTKRQVCAAWTRGLDGLAGFVADRDAPGRSESL